MILALTFCRSEFTLQDRSSSFGQDKTHQMDQAERTEADNNPAEKATEIQTKHTRVQTDILSTDDRKISPFVRAKSQNKH